MRRDWSIGAQDDLAVDPRLTRVARPLAPEDRTSLPFGLPLMCILAGVMAALLYTWPVLLIIDIMAGGFRPALFAWIVAGSAAVSALAFWAVTAHERRSWTDSVHALSDFADPPPWK